LSIVVVTAAVEVQPFVPVTVTVYVPAEETVIAAVVAEFDHKYVPLPLAVNVDDGMEQLNAKPLLLAIDAPGEVMS
jgi:hypothetical protein